MTFEEFARTELDGLVRFATVLARDRALAEDLCQDVLVKARTRWRRISAMDRPAAYIRQMLVNEHLSWRRKWSRLVPRAEVSPGGVSPDHADRVAEHADLLARVDALPPQQRVALALRYFEDLPVKDIAQIMGCRESTVRGYILRALRALRIDASASPSRERV